MGESIENETLFPDRLIDFLTWANMKSEAAKTKKNPIAVQLFNLIS